jgi:hypothetical protein
MISTNSSDNIANARSSFHLQAKDNSASSNQLNYSTEDVYLKYCYLINNYAYESQCIEFWYYNNKCEESNIINNSQETNNYGTLLNTNSATLITIINKCCLIKNNANNKGTLFCLYSSDVSTMEVRECTIQNGYSNYGALTSYSNRVAGSECAAITNCGTINVNTNNEYKCKCTVCDFEILHKFQKLYLNKQFYYK